MKISTFAALALSTLPGVFGNTPLDDGFVQNDMSNNKGLEIAFASRPMWHFGRRWVNNPCYPSAALVNGQQHGSNPDTFPNADTGCADPGPTGKGNRFPTYFTVNYCGTDELRVVYSLYFTHDGFSDAIIAKGHMHDWERIIVIWRRENGRWFRKELLKSFHSGYMHDNWDQVQNTITYDNPEEQRGKDKDGAKIYVGWGKHAMFSQTNIFWIDKISQGCLREFRSRNWWYIPEKSDMIPGGKGTPEGDAMRGLDWGSATSGPWVVEDKACAAMEGGFIPC